MTKAIKIEVQPEDIIEAVRKMKKRERGFFGRPPGCNISRIPRKYQGGPSRLRSRKS